MDVGYALAQGPPIFLKLRATSCARIHAKRCQFDTHFWNKILLNFLLIISVLTITIFRNVKTLVTLYVNFTTGPRAVGQPARNLGATKYFDFQRVTVYCLEQRLSKYKTIRNARNLWGTAPLALLATPMPAGDLLVRCRRPWWLLQEHNKNVLLTHNFHLALWNFLPLLP